MSGYLACCCCHKDNVERKLSLAYMCLWLMRCSLPIMSSCGIPEIREILCPILCGLCTSISLCACSQTENWIWEHVSVNSFLPIPTSHCRSVWTLCRFFPANFEMENPPWWKLPSANIWLSIPEETSNLLSASGNGSCSQTFWQAVGKIKITWIILNESKVVTQFHVIVIFRNVTEDVLFSDWSVWWGPLHRAVSQSLTMCTCRIVGVKMLILQRSNRVMYFLFLGTKKCSVIWS